MDASRVISRRGCSLSPPEICACNDNDKDAGSAALSIKVRDVGNKRIKVRDEDTALVAHLRGCTKNKDLHRGTRIHLEILSRGLLLNYSDALVTMYAKCCELGRAEVLLGIHQSRDAIPWTALIAGYAREGQCRTALDCFECMLREGIAPNTVTYICILKACATIGASNKGQEIHDEIARQELLQNNILMGTALVDMYAKCGALSKAQDVLEKLPSRDVVCWSALIAGYAQKGQGEQALNCFECMQQEGVLPNAVTYICILKACASIGAIDKGEQIHYKIVKQGLLQDSVALGNALVDMYAKSGALLKAHNVLENLPSRNVVTWNTLIAGYAQEGQGEQALFCFEQMQYEGILPNAVTYICALKACACIGAVDKGTHIHDELLEQGLLQDNVMLGTALVDMYAKCHALSKAQDALEKLPSRNVVSWSALIAGYAEAHQGDKALSCFEHMLHEGVLPNAVTYICVLKACAAFGALEKGKQVHEEIMKQGLLADNIILGNALVDMYVKCGALPTAQDVLKGLPSRDVVSWSSLIAGSVEEGQGDKALILFDCMQHEGVIPNAVTYICILKACATVGAIDRGEQIHEEVAKRGFLWDNVLLGNALVDMYAKCGALSKAQDVLGKLPCRDVVSWNTLIAGYAQAGQGKEALDCFECMQHEGILPNAVTFVCVLNVCSHLGLVDEAYSLFTNMRRKFGMEPDVDCFACMVDLLGRAGHLEKAVRLTQNIPFSDKYAVWLALLGACRKWGDINVGRWTFEQAVQVDKSDGQAYVLMANVYAAAGMHDSVEDIEAMRSQNNAW